MNNVNDHYHLRMFILDVLRHDDVEPLSSILKLLNNRGCIGWREFWHRDFTRDEVLSALGQLANDAKILVLQETPDQASLAEVHWSSVDIIHDEGSTWFGVTAAGRKAWSEWTPPALPEGVDR